MGDSYSSVAEKMVEEKTLRNKEIRNPFTERL
jgi:hypothetical protein